MLRKVTLLTIDSGIEQICCKLSQTGCKCECLDCDGTIDCVDCPNLTIADIHMLVYRSGDVNPNTCIPNYLLDYGAFSFDTGTDIACFATDMQLIDLPIGRYEGQINVRGVKAGNIHMFIGAPFGVCDPFTTGVTGTGNDMQPT